MITDEILSCVARFFDGGRGPSHDELTRQFRRFGLEAGDPQRPGDTIGKMKRVREVLLYAMDNDLDSGDKLVISLVGLAKAAGGFRPGSDAFAGIEVIRAAREGFATVGYDLDPEGNLRPALLENLEGAEASNALRAYARRAQVGSEDAALVLGTGKDLLEATARHVLVEMTGSYPSSANFPTTLYQAFDRLGLAAPTSMLAGLDSDPIVATQQALYLLANVVNRLRNAEGTGHGRPFLPRVTQTEARLATQAMGIVSQFLLDLLPSANQTVTADQQ